MAGYAPMALVRMRARRRRSSLRDLWPDAVDNIASGVRAGLALPEALSQLGRRGPEELRPAFAAFAVDYRSTGRFHDCLDRLKDRLSDPVADRLVESLRIAREVGGSDLGRLLRTLSTFLREDGRTRAELETRQGWTVNAARLAVAAPWVVLAMLSTRPESIRAYASTTGSVVLGVGAGVCAVAYRVMMHIGRLPEDGRVLR
jgi:tight adherence protein B